MRVVQSVDATMLSAPGGTPNPGEVFGGLVPLGRANASTVHLQPSGVEAVAVPPHKKRFCGGQDVESEHEEPCCEVQSKRAAPKVMVLPPKSTS